MKFTQKPLIIQALFEGDQTMYLVNGVDAKHRHFGVTSKILVPDSPQDKRGSLAGTLHEKTGTGEYFLRNMTEGEFASCGRPLNQDELSALAAQGLEVFVAYEAA